GTILSISACEETRVSRAAPPRSGTEQTESGDIPSEPELETGGHLTLRTGPSHLERELIPIPGTPRYVRQEFRITLTPKRPIAFLDLTESERQRMARELAEAAIWTDVHLAQARRVIGTMPEMGAVTGLSPNAWGVHTANSCLSLLSLLLRLQQSVQSIPLNETELAQRLGIDAMCRDLAAELKQRLEAGQHVPEERDFRILFIEAANYARGMSERQVIADPNGALEDPGARALALRNAYDRLWGLRYLELLAVEVRRTNDVDRRRSEGLKHLAALLVQHAMEEVDGLTRFGLETEPILVSSFDQARIDYLGAGILQREYPVLVAGSADSLNGAQLTFGHLGFARNEALHRSSIHRLDGGLPSFLEWLAQNVLPLFDRQRDHRGVARPEAGGDSDAPLGPEAEDGESVLVLQESDRVDTPHGGETAPEMDPEGMAFSSSRGQADIRSGVDERSDPNEIDWDHWVFQPRESDDKTTRSGPVSQQRRLATDRRAQAAGNAIAFWKDPARTSENHPEDPLKWSAGQRASPENARDPVLDGAESRFDDVAALGQRSQSKVLQPWATQRYAFEITDDPDRAETLQLWFDLDNTSTAPKVLRRQIKEFIKGTPLVLGQDPRFQHYGTDILEALAAYLACENSQQGDAFQGYFEARSRHSGVDYRDAVAEVVEFIQEIQRDCETLGALEDTTPGWVAEIGELPTLDRWSKKPSVKAPSISEVATQALPAAHARLWLRSFALVKSQSKENRDRIVASVLDTRVGEGPTQRERKLLRLERQDIQRIFDTGLLELPANRRAPSYESFKVLCEVFAVAIGESRADMRKKLGNMFNVLPPGTTLSDVSVSRYWRNIREKAV
ncbi:MAG: hypothetical protein QNJ16_15440, partial [Rhodobacter sp.]|nr:hypothetical protein [Rhodobacter sp.]